jgi:hypothetical protein
VVMAGPARTFTHVAVHLVRGRIAGMGGGAMACREVKLSGCEGCADRIGGRITRLLSLGRIPSLAYAITPPSTTATPMAPARTARERRKRTMLGAPGKRTPQCGHRDVSEETLRPQARHSLSEPQRLRRTDCWVRGVEHFGQAEATLNTVCPHRGHLINAIHSNVRVTAQGLPLAHAPD